MRQTISTLPVILSFMNFFVAQTSRTCFFFNVEKLNISAIYKSIIQIFSVKFGRKENLILPSGEPRGQHLGDFFNKERNCMIWTLFLCFSTKSTQFNIILSYLIVMYFWVQGSIIQTIYKSKRSYLIYLASKFLNISIGNFKTY